MAVGNLFQVRHFYTTSFRYCSLVTWWLEQEECTDDNPARSLAILYANQVLDEILSIQSEECFTTNIYVRKISGSNRVVYDLPFPLPGAVGGQAIPALAAAVLTLYTGLTVNPKRHSHHISGIAESVATDGVLTTGGVDGLSSIGSKLTQTLHADIGTTGAWWAASRSAGVSAVNRAYAARSVIGTFDRRRSVPHHTA